MTINLDVNRCQLRDLSAHERQQLMRRAQDDLQDVDSDVRQIIDVVRNDGSAGLIDLIRRYDKADLRLQDLAVTEEEFERAEQQVAPELRRALEHAAENVRAHHLEQLPRPSWMKEVSPGVISGERFIPIPSVGLYVPRGKGSFPSVMVMLCVPATLAQVPNIIVCTPPDSSGTVDAASLVAARTCGVST